MDIDQRVLNEQALFTPILRGSVFSLYSCSDAGEDAYKLLHLSEVWILDPGWEMVLYPGGRGIAPTVYLVWIKMLKVSIPKVSILMVHKLRISVLGMWVLLRS